jgi:hypothetical protein
LNVSFTAAFALNELSTGSVKKLGRFLWNAVESVVETRGDAARGRVRAEKCGTNQLTLIPRARIEQARVRFLTGAARPCT